MDIKKFRKLREAFNEGSDSPKKSQRIWKALCKAAKPEHVGKNVRPGAFDRIVCSCGWQSESFFDGAEYAWGKWLEHVADKMGLIPKKCPCGKTYLPFIGETACHELRPMQKEMTVSELLDMLESDAGDYYKEAVASIEKNRHMNDLTYADLKIGKKAKQRIAEAVLVDFINYVARHYGCERGERVKHLAEAFKKNKEIRAIRAERKKNQNK